VTQIGLNEARSALAFPERVILFLEAVERTLDFLGEICEFLIVIRCPLELLRPLEGSIPLRTGCTHMPHAFASRGFSSSFGMDSLLRGSSEQRRSSFLQNKKKMNSVDGFVSFVGDIGLLGNKITVIEIENIRKSIQSTNGKQSPDLISYEEFYHCLPRLGSSLT
jgi:hypothetical protein